MVRIVLNMAQNPLVFDRVLLRRRQARARALEPETFLIDPNGYVVQHTWQADDPRMIAKLDSLIKQDTTF